MLKPGEADLYPAAEMLNQTVGLRLPQRPRASPAARPSCHPTQLSLATSTPGSSRERGKPSPPSPPGHGPCPKELTCPYP